MLTFFSQLVWLDWCTDIVLHSKRDMIYSPCELVESCDENSSRARRLTSSPTRTTATDIGSILALSFAERDSAGPSNFEISPVFSMTLPVGSNRARLLQSS